MRKSILAVLLVFAIAGAVAAKDNLAILPFTGGAGEEGETIAELFSFESALTAAFTPVPRTSINRAIRNEQRFQMASGMTDPDTIAALGKQLGAQYVVSGSISTLGTQKLLIIAILKIDELRQIAGDIQTYGNIEEIQDKLPAMARTIVAAAKQDASRLPRLAVVPVQLAAGADKQDADVLAQILAAHIIKNGKYAVYPRTASLEQVENEYKNQLNGDTADEHLPDVGKGINPDLVLSVTARKLGTRNMFNAAVINLVTGVQEAGESVNYQSLNEGITAMTALAAALSGNKAVSSAEAVKPAPAPANTGSGNKRDWTVSNTMEFEQAIMAINADAKGGDYTVTLSGSFESGEVNFTANAAKTITLRGDGSVRTISRNSKFALFMVPKDISLVLDNNVTLNGNKIGQPLVDVAGGTFSMKTGSTVRDGNIGVYITDGSFMMSGGTISGNTASGSGYGGGVYVKEGGSFVKKGGTIDATNSARSGKVVYANGKRRESAAGLPVNLDSSLAGRAGDGNEIVGK